MTKFEFMINNGKIEKAINAIIHDLNKNETFDAWINAESISEIDSKLPEGYELDKVTTLENYFDHSTINKYQEELYSSAFIYFSNFEYLYEVGFHDYVSALDNDDMQTINKLDATVRN